MTTEGVEPAEAAAAIQRKLLPVTLAHAVREVPVYRDLYAEVPWQAVREPAELSALPFTSKALVIERWRAFLAPGHRLASLQYTSGTTGDSLFVCRSQEESDFISGFFADLHEPGGRITTCLKFAEAIHGTPTRIPTPVFVVQGTLFDDRSLVTSLNLMRKLQANPDVVPPVEAIAGTDTALRAFTHVAEREAGDLSGFGVAALHTHGDLLPPATRRRLERAWGAVLIDRYSLVEQFGGASRVPGRDLYLFDPHIVAEVVDPVSGAPCTSGRGVLVLTSLYPFVQMMPLIRYWTGDLVEIVQPDPPTPTLAVRLLGRLGECIADPDDGRVLLTPMEWREAVEERPEVAFWTRRRQFETPGIVRAIGRPMVRFRVRPRPRPGAPLRIVLQAGLEDTAARQSAPDGLAAGLREAVLAEAPELDAAVAAGRAALEVETLAATAWQPPVPPAGSVAWEYLQPA